MPSTNPIVKEMGRKPYINTKGIDGGYVNEMRRTPQGVPDLPPDPSLPRSRGATVDAREVISTFSFTNVVTTPKVSWGVAFDPAGGCYVTQTGDILYRAPGQPGFTALGQADYLWWGVACAPNGDVYASRAEGAGTWKPQIRAGGVGNFVEIADAPVTFFGVFGCAPNGDVYMSNWAGAPYKRTGGVGTFDLQTDVTVPLLIRAFAVAPNGDVYSGSGYDSFFYVRPGGVGDFVKAGTADAYTMGLAAAPNGDIYACGSDGLNLQLYVRRGGVGNFEPFVALGDDKSIYALAVSPAGVLHALSNYNADYSLYLIVATTTVQPPRNTISQTHVVPDRMAEPVPERKPYENQTYAEMQTQAQPVKYTGKELTPAPEATLPVLVAHIDEVYRYVRSGSPVVIDVPTNEKDPIAGVEIYGRVDGFASVAPNGTSVIYNPGTSGNALLTIHTKSGQQCTVNLMAK